MKKAPYAAGVFVLALLALSCAGTNTEVTKDVDATPTGRLSVDAHVGKSMTNDSTRIENITDKFTPNETVYAVIDVPDSKEGTMKVRWLYGSGETVLEQEVPLTSDAKVYRVQLTPASGGNRTGEYQLEITVNGERVETERFRIEGM